MTTPTDERQRTPMHCTDGSLCQNACGNKRLCEGASRVWDFEASAQSALRIASLETRLAEAISYSNAKELEEIGLPNFSGSDLMPEYFAKPGIPEALSKGHPVMLVRSMAHEIIRLNAQLATQAATIRELREEVGRSGRRIYLDCDGVLADFDAAFERAFGHPSRSYEDKHGTTVFWENLRELERPFYRHLPLMAGARELFDAVKHLRPIILTGCPLGGWAEMQKLAWAAEHFPGTPMIVCMSKNKRDYCRPGDVLIDDYLRYRDLWEQAGGVFIHHTSLESTLAALALPSPQQAVDKSSDK